MSHLPECFIEPNPLMTECRVCDALRACEQRVMLLQYNSIKGWQVMREAFAYAAGLDAAEAAVQTWISYTFPGFRPSWTEKITDAIRALKEKP